MIEVDGCGYFTLHGRNSAGERVRREDNAWTQLGNIIAAVAIEFPVRVGLGAQGFEVAPLGKDGDEGLIGPGRIRRELGAGMAHCPVPIRAGRKESIILEIGLVEGSDSAERPEDAAIFDALEPGVESGLIVAEPFQLGV